MDPKTLFASGASCMHSTLMLISAYFGEFIILPRKGADCDKVSFWYNLIVVFYFLLK
jgi:hypothetical protein